MVHGPYGDFAATIEVDGAQIGIVGLNLVDSKRPAAVSVDDLRAVCGRDPMQWASAHHLTILLTRPSIDEFVRSLRHWRRFFVPSAWRPVALPSETCELRCRVTVH
jgi:hypothetical protein